MLCCEVRSEPGDCFGSCSVPCSLKQDPEQGFFPVDRDCLLPPLPTLPPPSVARYPGPVAASNSLEASVYPHFGPRVPDTLGPIWATPANAPGPAYEQRVLKPPVIIGGKHLDQTNRRPCR